LRKKEPKGEIVVVLEGKEKEREKKLKNDKWKKEIDE
jgi:cytochrome b subunit of formate dehydrogenase